MAHAELVESGILVKNARLSFPSLFKKASFDGNEGKYEATLLIPKSDKEAYNLIMGEIEKRKADKKIKVAADKIFIKDGDDVDYDGYAGHWAIKASNSKRPTTIDGQRTPVVEQDEVFYAGCYVNAIVEPWAQSNQFGKRVNANLLGVQFVKDGESFEAGRVVDADAFGDLGEDDEF